MRRNLLMLSLFCVSTLLHATDVTITTNQTIVDGEKIIWNNNVISIDENIGITIQTGGELTINGNLTSGLGAVIVESGALLIVKGNIELSSTVCHLQGDIIVGGDVNLGNIIMNSASNLVAGGTFTAGVSDLPNVDGEIYLLDEFGNTSPPDINNSEGVKNLHNLFADENDSNLLNTLKEVNFNQHFTWIGGTSSDWTSTSNWQEGKVPGALANIIITNGINNPEINADVSFDSLTIENDATLTLKKGKALTVFGGVTIQSSGGLIVNNCCHTPSSLMVYGDISGSATFNSDLLTMQWWYLGAPVPDFDITNFGVLTGTDKEAIVYKHATNWQGPLTSGTVATMEGFGLVLKGDGVEVKSVSYSGQPNNNDEYTYALQDGYQLISNPYPAYYNLQGSADDFTNTTGNIYGYTGPTSGRIIYTYNVANGVSSPENYNILAPNQGFWVEKQSEGNVVMKKSRIIQDAGKSCLKSADEPEVDLLRVRLTNDYATDEAVIAFRESGSESVTRMDSEKWFQSGSKVSDIYSIKEETKLVINVLPLITKDISIPLGYRPIKGTHTLTIKNISGLTVEADVVLEDTEKEIKVLMEEGTEYIFEVGEEVIERRFKLHIYKSGVSTEIDDAVIQEGVNVYLKDRAELIVNCQWLESEKRISIYDLTGRLRGEISFTGNTYTCTLPYESGIYIVKVMGENKNHSQKIMIK